VGVPQDDEQIYYFRDNTFKNCHSAENGAVLSLDNGATVEIFGNGTVVQDNSALFGGFAYALG